MAHNLTIRLNGDTEMFYYGEVPWHGLGQRVEGALTSEEALREARLDWEVAKRPLFTELTSGEPQPVADHRAVVRTDTDAVLGIVSDGFRPVQNREAFAILDALVGAQAAMFHTAGSLGGGRRVWALVKLPQHLVVTGDDVVDQYLLLANGHDGSLALTMKFTPIRVVCQNTLSAALPETRAGRQQRVPDGVYIRHTESADVRIDEARRVLGIATRYFEVAGAAYRAMSAKQITDELLRGYLNVVFPLTLPSVRPTPAQLEAAERKQREIVTRVAFLFEKGRGNELPGVRGTVWAAYNGATEWVDHVYPLRKDGELKARGLETALLGAGAEIKQRAFAQAVALVA